MEDLIKKLLDKGLIVREENGYKGCCNSKGMSELINTFIIHDNYVGRERIEVFANIKGDLKHYTFVELTNDGLLYSAECHLYLEIVDSVPTIDWDGNYFEVDPDLFYLKARKDMPTGIIPQPTGLKYYKSLFKAFVNPTGTYDVSNWDMSGVENVAGMFNGANVATFGDLSKWNTANIKSFNYLFKDSFIGHVGNLGLWNMSGAENICGIFSGAKLASVGAIGNWNISTLKSLSSVFESSKINETVNLSGWDVSNITSMYELFMLCETDIVGIDNWNTASLEDLSFAFYGTTKYFGDLSGWDTSRLLYLDSTFANSKAVSFGDLSQWNTSRLTSLSNTWDSCETQSFGDISNWDVSNVQYLAGTFKGCKVIAFGDLSKWNTANVISMANTWHGCCTEYFGDLSGWSTANVETMLETFKNCKVKSFGNLKDWNLKSIKVLQNVFEGCKTDIGDVAIIWQAKVGQHFIV